MALLLRSIIALSILYLISATFAPSTFSTVPLLVWSGDDYFAPGSHNPELISNEQLETLFQRVAGLKNQDSVIEFVKTTSPEVVVVFVENKLRTDQFSQYARQGANEHQTFNRLRTAFKSSKTSASCPYVLASEYLPISDVISQTTNDLLQSSPTSTVYIVNDQTEAATQTQSGVINRSLVQFLEDISLGNTIFSNGVTDFVAIHFSPKEETTQATALSEDDSYIGTIHQIINKETNGNYIAVFTADTPQEKSIRRIRATKTEDENVEFTASVSNFFSTYFPIQVTFALFTFALLIIILLVGILCTMSIQAPQRFETARARRNE
jgi:hypothetical protein